MTLYVMNTFKAAQPALLYLVPACLGASVGAAVSTGSWRALLAYDEEEEKEETKKTQ